MKKNQKKKTEDVDSINSESEIRFLFPSFYSLDLFDHLRSFTLL
jgi:hypothetical protein